MIKITNLSKSYVKNKKVIDNLSLDINDGEILGIIGPNGVGKTTLIKMITGILEIDEGNIEISNIDIQKNPVEAKRKIGLITDNPDSFLKFKGIEYLNFIGDIYEVGLERRKELIIKYATIFEMEEAINEKIESYSHGMRQKIMIIGSLIHEPDNWILDEPMTGLDPKSMFELKKIMKEYAEIGKTVVFSTHILDVAEKICDRIAIINEGTIAFYGRIADLKNTMRGNKSLEEIFMEITKND